MGDAVEPSFASPAVLEFYRTLPFNFAGDIDHQIRAVRGHDMTKTFPALASAAAAAGSVIDVGCGVGWLALSMAHQFGAQVTGIDFNPVAIARAREAARKLGLSCRFDVADLFVYQPDFPVGLAVSMGVLHHTENCAAAVGVLCRRYIDVGGKVFVGLYHSHGRKPFLDHFRRLRDAGRSEEQLLADYVRLDRRFTDRTQQVSWFRDQVLHPHETQHTLAEMVDVLTANGMELDATSINGYRPFERLSDLFEAEKGLEDIGRAALSQGNYHPGFFSFIAHRVR
ncbi:MAG: class I SAM-dependent methyltransferase [Magnetospirillum sp.]|nr:MAG: class I SAM-dependent methyltransferase [Magnetospirillum sp.]